MTRKFQDKYSIHKVKFICKKEVWEVIYTRNVWNGYAGRLDFHTERGIPYCSLKIRRYLVRELCILVEKILDFCNCLMK